MKCTCGKTMKIDTMTEGKRSVVYHWVCPVCGYKTISIEEK